MGGSPTNGLVWVFSGLGCHPGGVCASGEETQNGRPGAERPGHHHRHQPEGAQHHTLLKSLLRAREQCRGKLLLKVMRYNIALLTKKVTNYVT